MRFAKTLFFVFFVCFLVGHVSYADNDAARSLFYEAGFLYKDGEYESAIEKYKEIIYDGRESANVYYNLGNCYYKIGKIGKSLLNYERAIRFKPRDSDLISNYKFVKSLVNDNVLEPEINWFKKLESKYLSSISVNEMMLIHFVLMILSMGLFIYFFFLALKHKKYSLYIVLLVTTVVVHTIVLQAKMIPERRAAIILAKTESRFEPTEESTTHYKLPEGAKVTLLSKEGDWIKVKRVDGKMGWVHRSYIEKI